MTRTVAFDMGLLANMLRRSCNVSGISGITLSSESGLMNRPFNLLEVLGKKSRCANPPDNLHRSKQTVRFLVYQSSLIKPLLFFSF